MDTAAYAEVYARDYVGPMFYYCLKKTGDRNEAEELSSDIALAVLHALNNYPPPSHFSAWVWKIAHNRYARWADGRMRHREHIAGEDIGEFDIADGETPEDAVVESEQYSLLRRELAFISREHRELIAAHYIENVKLSELSKRLETPVGTLKTRLYKARKILMEGMDMAREFGKRSYAPEDIDFVASGNQPSGLPWNAVDRKIPQNILLEASNNPSTAEELAMELGIALPYMEEEIDILREATLLKKLDDGKYITNFFIADKECQVEIYNMQSARVGEYARLLNIAICENYDALCAVVRPNVGETEFKWTIYAYILEKLMFRLPAFGVDNIFKRPCGGDWGFCGYEKNEYAVKNTFINHNGREFVNGHFGHMAVMGCGFVPFSLDRLTPALPLFAELMSDCRSFASLSEAEKEHWRRIEERYAHIEADGSIKADVLVFRNGADNKALAMLMTHPCVCELMKKLEELFTNIRRVLEQNSNPVLHESLDYYVSVFICGVNGMIIEELVRSGMLTVPSDPVHSNAGMYLILK